MAQRKTKKVKYLATVVISTIVELSLCFNLLNCDFLTKFNAV